MTTNNDFFGFFSNAEPTTDTVDFFSVASNSKPATENSFEQAANTPKQTNQPAEEAPVVPVKKKTSEKSSSGTKGSTSKVSTQKSKKISEVSSQIKKKLEEKANMKVDETWEVAYAGNRYNPPSEMTIEELRQHMELDYPELSKERCRMEVEEEKKLIVPIVSGAKKG